jgi:hypothetical protein
VSANDDQGRARKVFVVHGRNDAARSAMFAFLRSIGLDPIEWSEVVKMTGEGSPHIWQVLDTAFDSAQAIVVLFTPDDVAYLRSEYATGESDPETEAKAQARPNVLFEAGMAMGRDARRTVLVEMGELRPFSDVAGRHAVRIDDSAAKRKDLAQRLESAGPDPWLGAGCQREPASLAESGDRDPCRVHPWHGGQGIPGGDDIGRGCLVCAAEGVYHDPGQAPETVAVGVQARRESGITRLGEPPRDTDDGRH